MNSRRFDCTSSSAPFHHENVTYCDLVDKTTQTRVFLLNQRPNGGETQTYFKHLRSKVSKLGINSNSDSVNSLRISERFK